MNFLKYTRIEHLPKNLLIFLPLIISKQQISQNMLIEIIIYFLIFSVITLLIYFINDCSDLKIDKINKLKKVNKINKKIFNRENFYLSNFVLLILLVFLNYIDVLKLSLLIYVIIFYLYNFVLKKIRFVDIFSLISFYVCRIFYGAEILEIHLTNWFIVFFSTLFALLSLHKRLIQIKVNKLMKGNKIISYTLDDVDNMHKLLKILTTINIFIFAIYLYVTSQIFNVKIITLFIYSYILIYLLIKTLSNKIKIDIYSYAIKDKVTLGLTFIMVILTFVDYLSLL